MSPSLRNNSSRKRTPYMNRSMNDHSMGLARRRRSLRLQHSISLRIPLEELEGTAHINCYFDLGHQKFSLTYLEANDTQNPDSLHVLEGLKKKNWQVYFVKTLYNFNYSKDQMLSLSRALKNAFSIEFQNCLGDLKFNTEVITVDDLNPTDNDNQALKITALGVDDQKETLLYEGYLISWCSPEKSHEFNNILLPILICYGKKKYQTLIHTILSEKLDTIIERMVLTQGEFMHLSTYCLIMLDENDNFPVKMTYETLSSIIHFEMSSESLLKLWKKIHKDESIEVELDEVLLFNEGFEKFIECSFGMTLGSTLFQSVNVKGCYSLKRNGQVKFSSTKTIHVVLKYLNWLAIQRLKLGTQSSTEVDGSSSELPAVQL